MNSLSGIRALVLVLGISLSPAAMALDELSPGGVQASCSSGSPGGCGINRMMSFPPIRMGLNIMLNGLPLPIGVPCARPMEKRPPIAMANRATDGAVYKLLGNFRALAGVEYSDRFQNTSVQYVAPELAENSQKRLTEEPSAVETAATLPTDLPASATAQ